MQEATDRLHVLNVRGELFKIGNGELEVNKIRGRKKASYLKLKFFS